SQVPFIGAEHDGRTAGLEPSVAQLLNHPVTLRLVYRVTRARYCALRTCAPSCPLPRCPVAAGYLRPDRSGMRTRSSERTSSSATRLLTGGPPVSRLRLRSRAVIVHPRRDWLR